MKFAQSQTIALRYMHETFVSRDFAIFLILTEIVLFGRHISVEKKQQQMIQFFIF
jgi:hypothetical protein